MSEKFSPYDSLPGIGVIVEVQTSILYHGANIHKARLIWDTQKIAWEGEGFPKATPRISPYDIVWWSHLPEEPKDKS